MNPLFRNHLHILRNSFSFWKLTSSSCEHEVWKTKCLKLNVNIDHDSPLFQYCCRDNHQNSIWRLSFLARNVIIYYMLQNIRPNSSVYYLRRYFDSFEFDIWIDFWISRYIHWKVLMPSRVYLKFQWKWNDLFGQFICVSIEWNDVREVTLVTFLR